MRYDQSTAGRRRSNKCSGVINSSRIDGDPGASDGESEASRFSIRSGDCCDVVRASLEDPDTLVERGRLCRSCGGRLCVGG